MNLAHRLASKVASNMIALAYNPDQTKIIKLLWNMYKIIYFVIQ